MYYSRLIIISLILLIGSVARCGEWQSRIDSLKATIDKETNDSALCDLHLSLAEEYFLNKPQNTLLHLQEALLLADKLADSNFLYATYLGISDYYNLMNDYQGAMDYSIKAIEMAKNKSQKATCHNSLSEIFYFNDDMEKSLFHARKAYNINKAIGDTGQLSIDMNTIGSWHLEVENYDSALYYLYNAHQLHQLYYHEESALILSNIGQTYSYMNKFDSALHHQYRAYELDSLNESEYEMCIDENYISNTYLRKKDFDKAISYALKSLHRSEQLDLSDMMYYNYQQLSETYEYIGDFETALKFAKLSNQYADTVRDQNKDAITLGLEAKYQFNQQKQLIASKNLENSLLKKQKKLLLLLTILGLLLFLFTLLIIKQVYQRHKARKKLLQEIEKANVSKDRILSVISHDLRSSIGTIKNTIELTQEDDLEPEEINNILANFYPVVESTYDLLENLLSWAYYNKEDLKPSISHVGIKQVTENAIIHVQHLADSKSIEIINVIEDITCLADSNMLAIVVRNLLSNAIKFSNPNSKVYISSCISNKMCEVTIKDKGIGIQPDVLENLFTSPTDYHTKGTRGERGSGLGLTMCKSFIDNLGGSISAESVAGNGSSFTFRLPVGN